MRRSGKFYFKNEKEVMQSFGLTPTKGSGSSWVEKEDGYNDYILAQLKSTDKESYKLTKLDLDKLEYNASITHKLPVFILEFLNSQDIYFIIQAKNIPSVAKYIETGQYEKQESSFDINLEGREELKSKKEKKVKTNPKARNNFWKQKEKEWENWKSK